MKDTNIENVGATAFDLPNSQNPEPNAPIFYGSIKVPHPTNSTAKIVDHAKAMTQVLTGK
jgi:hypothetical protein